MFKDSASAVDEKTGRSENAGTVFPILVACAIANVAARYRDIDINVE